jgi:hypothetical protein
MGYEQFGFQLREEPAALGGPDDFHVVMTNAEFKRMLAQHAARYEAVIAAQFEARIAALERELKKAEDDNASTAELSDVAVVGS